MMSQIINIFSPIGAFILGAVIGLSFGMIQKAALARNKKLEETKELSSGWAVMPGSMSRVAYLVIVLAVIQLACPLFFEGNTVQWIVSAGVVLGYGWTLYTQLRQRSARI